MKTFNNISLFLILFLLFSCSSTLRKNNPDSENFNNETHVVKITSEVQSSYDTAIKYLKNNQIKKAQQLLVRLAKDNPGISGIHLNLALIYYRSFKFELSRQSLNKVLKISSKNSLAFNLSGTLYREAGKFKLAREAYLFALKLSPNYADAHLNIAILFDIYLESFKDAKQHYLSYLELNKGDNTKIKLWLQDLELRISKG